MVSCTRHASTPMLWMMLALLIAMAHSKQQIKGLQNRKDQSKDPTLPERADHVMGKVGETAEAVKRQVKIKKEQESAGINECKVTKPRRGSRNHLSRRLSQAQRKQRVYPDLQDSTKNVMDNKNVAHKHIQKRGVYIAEYIDDELRYWPGGVVPYTMDGLTDAQKRARFKAHNHIEMWSCIRFLERTTEDDFVRHIVTDGCTASIGKRSTDGTGQAVSCCGGEACVHEYGHVLGLHHEQLNGKHYNYTRFNYGDMPPELLDAWTPVVDGDSDWLTDDYQIGSVMHYKPWHSRSSHRESVTVLDPDQEYMLFDSDHTHFTLFRTLSRLYKCRETFCPSEECYDGGYVTMIRDECTCRCPVGQDPSSQCLLPYQGDATPASAWPSSAMAVIGSIYESCPDGLQESSISLATSFKDSSNEYSAGIMGNDEEVFLSFCTKDQTSEIPGEAQWEPGSYCIVKVGNTCPAGFESSSFTFNSVNPPLFSGPVPSHTVVDTAVQIFFCCRDDGLHQDPIRLPSMAPFVMLRKNGRCQTVIDMEVLMQDVVIEVDSATWQTQGNIPDNFRYWSVVKLYLCYYAAVHFGEGHRIELEESHPKMTVPTNIPYDEGVVEYYLIRSPENTKIKLNFESFNLETSLDGSYCLDYVELFYFLPGQEGVRYCGTQLGKTFISQTNYFNIKFVNAFTFNYDDIGQFNFTVELIRESDMCYTGHGESYAGNKDVTRHYEPCLPWSAVKDKCIRNPYELRYFDSTMESNYCRNPDQGTRPWCYTSIDGCRRDYCDVCNLEPCYDIDAMCEEILIDNPTFCNDDEEAKRICRKTCGHCGDTSKLPAASAYHCDGVAASYPDASPITPLKSTYALGETVTFQCNTGEEQRVRMCTTNGWTGGNYVCGQCSNGWTPFNGKCYKFFLKELPFEDSIAECALEGAELITIKDQETQDFANKLRGEPYSYWLGIEQCDELYTCPLPRQWLDGSNVTWSNFHSKSDEENLQVYVISTGQWESYYYRTNRTFICQKSLTNVPTVCADQIPFCRELLSANPDTCMKNPEFRMFQCAKTCGHCSVLRKKRKCKRGRKGKCLKRRIKRCKQGRPRPVNTERVMHTYSDGQKKEKVGSFYEYKCIGDYELFSGNLKRACLDSGKLTGTRPVCKPKNEITSCNNDIELLSRQEVNDFGQRMQIMDNPTMIAHKSGILQRISFYSMTQSSVVFLILRRNSTSQFTLMDTIDVTSGFKRIINANISHLGVAVEESDYLGFYFKDHVPVMTYDRCFTAEDRVMHDGYMYTDFMFPNQITLGMNYEFIAAHSSQSCRINSIKMCIK